MSNDSTFKIPDKYSSIDGTDRHVRRLLVPLKGLALPVHGVLAGERRTERKLLLQGHEIESEYASITIDLPESGGLNISEHETTKLNGVVLAKGSSRRERGLEAVGHTTRRWLRRRQGRQAACELMPEDGARVRGRWCDGWWASTAERRNRERTEPSNEQSSRKSDDYSSSAQLEL